MSDWKPIFDGVNFFFKPGWYDWLSHIDEANAPTLYTYDKDGYISSTLGRSVSAEEQEEISRYNDFRRALNNQQRDALDNFLHQLFPITSGVFTKNDALITELQNLFTTAENTISPLVLDLDGDGVETTSLTKGAYGGVHFNLDAKGLSEQVGWVGQDDGLLVRDLDGNGKIDSGRELFGNHTLLKTGAEAANANLWRQAA